MKHQSLSQLTAAIDLNVEHLDNIAASLRSDYEQTGQRELLEPTRKIERGIDLIRESRYLLSNL